MSHRTINLLMYLAAASLAVSMFLPLAELPVLGRISYYGIAEVETYVIIAMTMIVPFLIIAGRERLCLIPAIAIWGTLLWPALENEFRPAETNLLNQALGQSQRIMQEFAVDLFRHLTEFSWGGLLMLAALVVLTLTALVRLFR